MVIYSGFSHWKWWFSIVMLVYQRVNIEIKYAKLTHLPPERGYHFLWLGATRTCFGATVHVDPTIWSCSTIFFWSTKDVKLLTSCISVCHVCCLNLAFLHLTILNTYGFCTALTSFESWRISTTQQCHVVSKCSPVCSPDQVGSMVGDPPA